MYNLKKFAGHYFLTILFISFCFLLLICCNYTNSIVDPNSEEALIPLFTVPANTNHDSVDIIDINIIMMFSAWCQYS